MLVTASSSTLATLAPMSAPKAPATYADLEALPEHVVGEIVDGVLYASPRPAMPHALASSELQVSLGGPFGRGVGGPGGWLILTEPELHLGPHVVVPDLAGWRRERLPVLPDAPWLELAPDWVCEVLSPSTAYLDRRRKLPVYAQAGVPHVWLVDPLAQSLEVFALDGTTFRLAAVVGTDERARLPPFDAIELDLALLWRR